MTIRISGNESFTQLYQKTVSQRGSEDRVSGGRTLTTTVDGGLGSARVSWSGKGGKRAAHVVYQSIKKEYGKAVADRVFREVTGQPVGRDISLAELRAMKAELGFEKPLDLADRSSSPPARFSSILRFAEREARTRGLSGSKHLRFKGAKGLYFHSASFGSMTGIGNWLSGESPSEKREDAGARLWKSLANEVGRNTADRIFRNVFGDRAVSSPAGDAPRVAVSLDDLAKLRDEVEQQAPEVFFQKLGRHERRNLERQLDLKNMPQKAVDASRGRVAIGPLAHGPARSLSEADPSARPTGYQDLAKNMYQDNPATALAVLGDVLTLYENQEKLKLTDPMEAQAIQQLLSAADDALGGKRDEFRDLAKITNLVCQARDGHIKLSPNQIRDLKRLLGDLAASFDSRLQVEQRRFKDLKDFGSDFRKFTGTSRVGSARDPSAGPGNRQTTLRRWHDLKVEQERLKSDLHVLSGKGPYEMQKAAESARKSAEEEIKKLKRRLETEKLDPKQQQEIKEEIDSNEARIREEPVIKKASRDNYNLLLQRYGIDRYDNEARKNAVTDLKRQIAKLDKDVPQARREHINHPDTRRMVGKYGPMGFKADIDYLDGDNHINTPMLGNRTVGTMTAAKNQIIPMLYQELDEL